MLRIEEAKTKTYEENIDEAIAEIPLYSKEWTNFNVSDPGITILENFSAFSALQAAGIPRVSYEARLKLLALAGIKPNKAKCARVLVKAEGLKEKTTIPAGSRFSLGDMIFETNRPASVGGKMLGIYSKCGDEERDISFLADSDIPVSAEIFGGKPREGSELYFVTDSLPEADKELILYVTLQGAPSRNAVEERTANVFASVRWECYTDNGFTEVKPRDYTGCFLTDGEIRIRIPEGAAQFGGLPVHGYCIKATLERACYDVAPRLAAVESFLFELWQRDSRAASLIFNRADHINIRHPLAEYEHILVFGKEEKGSSYRRYELSYDGTEPGRKVRYIQGELDKNNRQRNFTLEFVGKDHLPDTKLKDPVRVVLFNPEVMQRYEIGRVLGYDDQEIDLPFKMLVQDSFCLIARRRDEEGTYLYDFVRPEKKGEGSLYYHLLENDGRILIEDAGNYIGADLFIGSIAVFEGEKGNVRPHSSFKPLSEVPKGRWFSPGPGTGGARRESLRDMVIRFRKDLDAPYTAVTAADYERLALTTPGLCLSKAHAVIDEAENLVQIAVLPGYGGEKPELSDIYRKEIQKRLEERRLLTTRIRILSPSYVDIHVRATVYVKRHYTDPKGDIVRLLNHILDDVHSDRSFGQVLHFRDVFSAIESLECVSFVYELSLLPDDRSLAEYRDSDIYPRADVLCRAGDILIETVASD
ncbi:MAG: baseplate J/gp47 family protein [Lachnospiraceae bacterium]|nr:baseplate J/gp47 family protein [Lachnospiraceae bacterium]